MSFSKVTYDTRRAEGIAQEQLEKQRKLSEINKKMAKIEKREKHIKRKHEELISKDDAKSTFEYDDYYKILPQINQWSIDSKRIQDGKKVSEEFSYKSDNNLEWMTKLDLQNWIDKNKEYIGNI